MLRGLLLCFFIVLPISTAKAELLWSQSFESQALGAPLRFSIYLPPGYHDPRDDSQALRYPVVYLLPGVGDNERAYPAFARVEAMADRMISDGDIPPMILVMPNGATSWYVDSSDVGGPGNYATAIRTDLIRYIDQSYRTIADRSGRYVTGHSMGGFGALRLAFERPDLFGGTAAMSSALWSRVTEDFVLPEGAKRIFQSSFGDPFDPIRFLELRPRGMVDELKTVTAEHGLHLPIYLSAGDDDQFRAYRSTFELAMELREADLDVELRILQGGHTWELWRERALPDVLQWFSSLIEAYKV